MEEPANTASEHRCLKEHALNTRKVPVPALALGGVDNLPRASRFRGLHSSKKRTLQAVDC